MKIRFYGSVGGIPRYVKISLEMAKNVGAAVSAPKIEEPGSVKRISIINLGSSAGANPINEAMVLVGS